MRPRLASRDRLLLALTLPMFILTFAAHVRESARTGLAQLPVFAEWQPGDYPRVGGFRLETDSSDSGLEIGDRLIRIGDRDLRGVGYIGFQAIGLARTTPGSPVELVFEHRGERRTGELVARPHPHPWSRIAVLLMMATLSTLLMLRAPGQPEVRRFHAFFMAYAIGQAHFYGGPEWQTWVAQIVWSITSVLSVFLMIRWARGFPPEMPAARRVSPAVAWLAAGLYLVFVRLNYILAWPLPIEWVPRVSFAYHGLATLTGGAILTWNYTQSAVAGRRRLRWILLGTVVGSIPVTLAALVPIFAPDWTGFRQAFALGFHFSTIWCIGAVVATIRDNAFDVDRLISATAAGALILGAAVAGLTVAVPSVSDFMSTTYAVDPTTTRLGLAAVVGALVITAAPRLRRRMDLLLVPERIDQEERADRLAEAFREAETPSALLERAAAGCASLFEADRHAVYVSKQGDFVLQAAAGSGWPPTLPAHARPRVRIRRGGSAELARAQARVALPLLREEGHSALLCLGPKRSGDIYTNRDLRVLSTIAAQAERDWMRLLKRAADLESQAKTNLLAEAGHDLRQPLHAVSLLTNALRSRLDDPDLAALVERIGASTQDLDEMLTSLLDRSKLDAGGVRPEIGDVALAEVFAILRRDFEIESESAGVTLRVVPTARMARSDRLLLVRILRNLVANAIRYAPRGKVVVGCRKEGDRIRIEVRDDGPGIPLERQQEIFGAFTQLPGASRSGLGLGLSIADGLARLLGHEVRVVSAPGRGSTFALVVQKGREATPCERGAIEVRPPADWAGKAIQSMRVLVVEDDERVREASSILLAGWGAEVRVAANGDAALALVAGDWRPDLMIVDHHLGAEETGLEVARRIRSAIDPSMPVIVATAERSERQLEHIRAEGHVVLRKPVRPAQLRTVIRSLEGRTTEPDRRPAS